MKPFTLLQLFHLITFLIMPYGIKAQTIYVKFDASGANDGTSWQNAFTDFSEALDSASGGAVLWVAAGVYHPGGSSPDANSVFTVRQNISIFGGFAGVEVNLKDRNPSINLTVLSGDINEDDTENNFVMNKNDNTLHVVYVDSFLTRVEIDGFTVRGGHTSDNANENIYNRSGGGIHALAPININQCHITGNFGRAGGGVYISNRASSSIVTNCRFSFNKTTQRGAGLFALLVSDIIISDCSFYENNSVRGSLCFFSCRNVEINNSIFENNQNLVGNGGALGSFQNINLIVSQCQFIRNSALSGGSIVVAGDLIPIDSTTNIRIEDCQFQENIATKSGGAIYLFTCPDIIISKCEFKNDSAGTGGSIYVDQPQNYSTDTNDIRIDSCLFEGNKAGDHGGGALFMRFTGAKVENSRFESNTTEALLDGGGGHIFHNCPSQYVICRNVSFLNGQSLGFGGAALAYGKDAHFLFEFCYFENNLSDRAGGAVHNVFGANAVYRYCEFRNNASTGGNGGALSLSHDSTTVRIEKSSFIGNEAAGDGGAIVASSGSNIVELQNCILDSNSVFTGFGGAISIVESGNDDIAYLSINNSIFRYNSSTIQGGALNISDADAQIINSVFAENICSELGIGGAISIKASDQDTVKGTIINSSIVDNHGYLADGLAQEEGILDGSVTTKIQNCIFRNQGIFNYNIEAGTPELVSQGGNMSDDESMNDILILKSDLNQMSPLFDLDYSLLSNSPGIDAGVADGAPEFDILGNPRVNAPDMGAYENQMPVSVRENIFRDKDTLKVYPNPVKDQNPTGILNNDWNGEITIQLSDLKGEVVFSEKSQKPDDLYLFTLSMQYLNTGNYQLLVSNGQKSITENIIKIE